LVISYGNLHTITLKSRFPIYQHSYNSTDKRR